MNTNKNRLNAWDRIMMAITFAEANEHESAREILDENRNERRPELRNRKEERPEIRV